MANNTTSDKLKKAFSSHGGGDEKDWKRLSKKKNEDGEWLRRFENKKTGVQVEVLEKKDGTFLARHLTDDFAAANDTPVTTPVIDNDPARNKAANKVIDLLLAPYEDEDAEEEEIPPALLKQAGTALANRFIFSIGGDPSPGASSLLDGGFYVEFSPIDRDYDQHLEPVISHLLPPQQRGEVTELTFDFSSYTDEAKLASDLMKRGFIWEDALQADLQAHLATLRKPAAKPPQP